MTFIETIYQELRTNRITNNSEDFSQRFLQRSPRYYSSIKAQGLDANSDVLLHLLEQLETTTGVVEKYCDATRVQCLHGFQQKVADELVKRAFVSKTTSKTTLNNVKSALQRIEQDKSVA